MGTVYLPCKVFPSLGRAAVDSGVRSDGPSRRRKRAVISWELSEDKHWKLSNCSNVILVRSQSVTTVRNGQTPNLQRRQTS